MTNMGRAPLENPKQKFSISMDVKIKKIVNKVADKYTGGNTSKALELIVKSWKEGKLNVSKH